MDQGGYGTYLHLVSPDISRGHGVHPGAGIQEDPGASPVHLSPTEVLGAQPAGERILVAIAEGSFGGNSSYWGLLVGGLWSPCLLFPFFGWGTQPPLPPVPPFWFKASRLSNSCNSGSRGSLVHSLQRRPSSRQLKQRPNHMLAESAA